MSSKGSGNGCCCTSCEEIPFTAVSIAEQPINPGVPLDPISFAGSPLDLGQAFCCTCLPKSACVSLYCYDSDTYAKGRFDLRCNLNVDSDTNGTVVLYSGTIDFRGDTIDLEFSITVIDQLCYFCLTSYALSIINDCKLVDADSRSAPQFFCHTLTNNPANIGLTVAEYPTEWLAASGGCGLLAVTIGRDDLTPITKRRTSVDANGVAIPDDSPIKNICSGCGCICTTACISLQYPRYNLVLQGAVPLASVNTGTEACPHWVTDNYYQLDDGVIYYGIKISVVAANEYGNRWCALQLESAGSGVTFGEVPELWMLVTDSGTDCPHPEAMWETFDADGFPIIVRFACANCGDCGSVPTACCPGTEFPQVLHCTIAKGDPAASSFCECLPLTIPMVYMGDGPSWQGILKSSASANQSWCFPSGTNDVKVKLTCGSGWILQFGNEGFFASPCGGTLTSPTLVCDPIEIVFTEASFCCGMGGPASVIITITE